MRSYTETGIHPHAHTSLNDTMGQSSAIQVGTHKQWKLVHGSLVLSLGWTTRKNSLKHCAAIKIKHRKYLLCFFYCRIHKIKLHISYRIWFWNMIDRRQNPWPVISISTSADDYMHNQHLTKTIRKKRFTLFSNLMEASGSVILESNLTWVKRAA